ncbi:MalY/PatB family protein [Polynucleobacter sp. IMCC 29146]|uniref:MalY/PatB family protein n=1 Tax=Polynucleobacter sp. IMCC 29146 TaxID=2780953 RepID=UPI001F2A3E0B|nr:PatB family C-S lyase [Polynucleobacter sp. IMCC 29146]MCE7530081.1 PatB family C-S lyase [Polynucleobacter sp. IMCC 29146]
MVFNFDAPINRRKTDSIRWDANPQDVIPLWVADMDFACPPCVVDALSARVQHGVFGYTHSPRTLPEAIANYLQVHYKWEVDPSWIVFLPNVVSGLHTAVRQLTTPNQHVLIPRPVYHHLRLACTQAPRDFTELPLALEANRWVLPFAQLDEFAKPGTRLLLLCNPQNPGGTVFTRAELSQIADFCLAKDILICADEIHAGLVLDDNKRHIPIASLSKAISMNTVTLMSLNKTFNFPGAGLAWAVAENPLIRKAMQTDLHSTIADPSLFSYVATQAALDEGEPWRKALIQYLRENRNLVETRINASNILHFAHSEASYLAWIDCSKLGLAKPQDLFLQHGVHLSPGSQFNEPKFVRLNFGTQRALLNQALDRMELAIRN